MILQILYKDLFPFAFYVGECSYSVFSTLQTVQSLHKKGVNSSRDLKTFSGSGSRIRIILFSVHEFKRHVQTLNDVHQCWAQHWWQW